MCNQFTKTKTEVTIENIKTKANITSYKIIVIKVSN